MDGERANQVQRLFVDSARFAGTEPPKYFRMTAGEIYYEGGKIKEVKLRGMLPPVKDEEWDEFPTDEDKERLGLPTTGDDEWALRMPTWRTDAGPDFSWVDDLRLAFSPRDLGRPYVAALGIGKPFLLWWDVRSESIAPPPAGTDVRFIRVTPPVKRPGRGDDRAGFEAAIRYAEALARSADEMRTLMKLLRDGGELEFIDQYRAFGHAFESLLGQRPDAGGTGRLKFSMRAMGETEMRRRLVSAVAAVARDYLIIRAGRRAGSKTKIRNPESGRGEKASEKSVRLKKKILGAITAEYTKLRGKWPPAEAESRVTATVVIAKLKTPRSTFYDQLRRGGYSFDDLKTEALRSAED